MGLLIWMINYLLVWLIKSDSYHLGYQGSPGNQTLSEFNWDYEAKDGPFMDVHMFMGLLS